MLEIFAVCLCIIIIILLKFILKIDYKKAKAIEENIKLQKITDRFPDNEEIAKKMLEILNNKDVKIEKGKNIKTSLYIALTNKIVIADLKDNYGRIQTIAHECIHSVQDRRLLLFNFWFSNFSIAYFLISTILTITHVFNNHFLQAFIILLVFMIQIIVRGYLEIDAMTKSKFLAKEYIKQKNICKDKEINELLNEYSIINEVGIPFYLFSLVLHALIKEIIFLFICVFL